MLENHERKTKLFNIIETNNLIKILRIINPDNINMLFQFACQNQDVNIETMQVVNQDQ
jgi:hypothetical protein